jgi:hypothetical protein
VAVAPNEALQQTGPHVRFARIIVARRPRLMNLVVRPRGRVTGGVMQIDYATVGYVHLIAAIVCARWAMDLGFSQSRQLLWGVAGIVAAPLVLLILYVRLIRKGLT